MRKRRVSTDSHDSVSSHVSGHMSHAEIGFKKTVSKLTESSFNSEKKKSKSSSGEKIKKKHKKSHKHHDRHHSHKSHKHKRHKSGDGSSSKKHEQKFAVRSRSPLFLKTDPEDNDHESSEASQEESEQQNTSDDEVTINVLIASKYVSSLGFKPPPTSNRVKATSYVILSQETGYSGKEIMISFNPNSGALWMKLDWRE